MRIAIARLLPITLISLGVALPPAMAGTIAYEIDTTATGTLGTSSFTNAAVTLTLFGDTSFELFLAGHEAVFGTAVVNISGVGTATLLGVNDVVYNPPSPTPFVTIEQEASPPDPTSGVGILGIVDASLLGYDLITPFGPLTSTGGPASGSQVPTFFTTNAGDLNFVFGSGSGNATFTATVLPEPSSIFLVGSVLVIALIVRHRPRKRLIMGGQRTSTLAR
jgi:hypothetical protein